MEPDYKALISTIEKDFSIPEGYFVSFLREDDWSFIIKIHALLEAAASQLLAHAAGDVRLQKVFERLELSNKDTGKLAFLKALELFDKKQQSFVVFVSRLRNDIVHDIRNINFKFKDHMNGMDDNQKASFVDKIIAFNVDDPTREYWRNFIFSNPKGAIWAATFSVVVHAYMKIREIKLEREYTAETMESVRQMLEEAEKKLSG
jgi:hypothetical protein